MNTSAGCMEIYEYRYMYVLLNKERKQESRNQKKQYTKQKRVQVKHTAIVTVTDSFATLSVSALIPQIVAMNLQINENLLCAL